MNQTLSKLSYNKRKSEVFSMIYPVGAIYLSTTSTNPATYFGGTWEQLKDKFLLAAGSTYTAGSTGGSATHTLTTSEMPSHTHSVGAHSHGLNSHTHGLNNHTHSVGAHSHGLNSHTHGSSFTIASKTPSHIHSSKGCWNDGSGTGSGGGQERSEELLGGDPVDTSNAMLSGGAHTHTISGTSGAASGSTANSSAFNSGGNSGNTAAASGSTANSTAFNSGSSGSGTAFSIMPPYTTVYAWARTA